jgi:chromosome partitioning protein
MTLDGGPEGPFIEAANDERTRDEHPAVVLRDLEARRRPSAHVITFANEKGGVGKSTLAFHCAVALAHRGLQVLVVDCDRRQQTLQRHLEARDGTARALKVALPRPRHVVLDKQSGAVLMQEIARVGADCDFIVIDLPGQDSPFARRAIALADTVVTPVNCSPTDIDALGLVNPVNHRFRQAGAFAAVVSALRQERLQREGAAFDWIVAKNRVRHCERRLIGTVDANLATIARHLGFRTIAGLTERVGYREMLSFGLTQFDLALIPGLGSARAVNVRELRELVAALDLPSVGGKARVPPPPKPAAPLAATALQSFRDAVSGTVPLRPAANVA